MSKHNRLDITQVVDEHLCHSCGACFASCGHNSISFHESVGGYYVPKIDYDTCTGCELCFEVCSGDHFGKTLTAEMPEDPFVGNILSCEVGKATNQSIFENSQSGGVTTALLGSLLDSGEIEVALVAITKEDTPPRGDFALVRDSKELYASQKSKYTPIALLSAIPQLKKVQGKIAIVGLSCHLQSLQNLCDTYKWLGKKDIFKIGLICDRVMTSTAIDFMAKQATDEPIKNFIFRDKAEPSYPGNPVVITNDDTKIVLDKSLRMEMKDFFTPARCRLCFDKLNIFADVVMGDPHGVTGTDRQHGETLVLTRTSRGEEVIQLTKELKTITLRNADKVQAVKGQKIDRKKIEWSAYTTAWKALGKKAPEYPFVIESNDFKKEIKSLEHSLSLDDYNSKEALLTDAQKYYNKKKFKRTLRLPLVKLKAIVKKIIKR